MGAQSAGNLQLVVGERSTRPSRLSRLSREGDLEKSEKGERRPRLSAGERWRPLAGEHRARRVTVEGDKGTRTERKLLTCSGILTRSQFRLIQDVNTRFVRSRKIFIGFIEQWIDAEHHGLKLVGEAVPSSLLGKTRELLRGRTRATSPPTSPVRPHARPHRASSSSADATKDSPEWLEPARDYSADNYSTGCRVEDVFFWAVLMGDTALADVLWRFSHSHLRLALLAADIYTKMATVSEQGRKHRDEIEPMRVYWENVATDMLEAIHAAAKDGRTTFRVAYEILTWELTEPKRAGEKGENVLDLATRLQAKQFIAHRYCQLIMTRNWAGHKPDPKMMLRLEDDTSPNWKVVLKALFPWRWVEELETLFKVRWLAKVVLNVPDALDSDPGGDNDEDDDKDDASEVGDTSLPLPGWWHVYSIPAIKFWIRTILTHGGVALTNALLVAASSIASLDGLSDRPGPVQGMLELIYVALTVGIALDWVENRPARRAWERSGSSRPIWARIDTWSLIWQALVVVLRVAYLIVGEFISGYGRTDAMTTWLFPLAIAFSSLSCFFRFLIETLLVFPRLGVLAICTREMLADNLVQWGVMMAIVMVAFGLAFASLIPNYPLQDSSSCKLQDLDDLLRLQVYGEDYFSKPACPQRYANGPFFISVWALFGDFSIDKLEQQRALIPALFLVALLIIAQVLLLNLLIAMMTDTYTAVNSRALVEWKYEHMLLVDYYVNSASSTPPPLNLIIGPSRWLAACARSMRSVTSRRRGGRGEITPSPNLAIRRDHSSKGFTARESWMLGAGRVPDGYENRDETRAYHQYLQTRAKHETAELGARVDEVNRVVKALEYKQMEDREALDVHMLTVGSELGWLKQQVSHVPRASVQVQGRGKEHGIATRVGRRTLHRNARSEGNSAYAGQRAVVPDWRVPWEVDWPAYEPIEFEHAVVKAQPVWADPPDAAEVAFEHRRSFEQLIICSPIGRPLNPRGRTGTSARGLLGKWGPNHAADPIVLRRKPRVPGAPAHDAKGVPGGVLFQMVAIKRADSGQWAIPGGMVDDGELVSETLRREFTEEAGALNDPLEQADLEDALDEVFKDGGRQVYRGYVDDPRNTDNAWMETTVYCFYIEEKLASRLTLSGGSDALQAQWLDVDGELLRQGSPTSLYADHREFVLLAISQEKEYLKIPLLAV